MDQRTYVTQPQLQLSSDDEEEQPPGIPEEQPLEPHVPPAEEPHGSGSRINIRNLGYDLVSGLTLKKTQETIAELQNQMLPHQAVALKMLRQHEEDLKAQELIAATGASLTKKTCQKEKT